LKGRWEDFGELRGLVGKIPRRSRDPTPRRLSVTDDQRRDRVSESEQDVEGHRHSNERNAPATDEGESDDVEAHRHSNERNAPATDEGESDDVEAHRHEAGRHEAGRHEAGKHDASRHSES
jgi:hypothetical protein